MQNSKFYLYQLYSSRLHAARITDTENICCHMTKCSFFKYFKHFKN